MLSASSACFTRCLYSPCTGIEYLGFKIVYIILISSCDACPDTWVSWKITLAPFIESSLISLATDFSLPGIGVALTITTSPGLIVTFYELKLPFLTMLP